MFVKTPVFPFVRFPGVDTILGPEMKSTGEVMGGSTTFGAAFAKACSRRGQRLPERGTAFISVNNDDKPNVLPIAPICAISGSASSPRAARALSARPRHRVRDRLQGQRGRPNIVDTS